VAEVGDPTRRMDCVPGWRPPEVWGTKGRYSGRLFNVGSEGSDRVLPTTIAVEPEEKRSWSADSTLIVFEEAKDPNSCRGDVQAKV
jgi:hypothetical protein